MWRRTVRGIGWAVLLVTPPAGLIWWVGWPLPTRSPSQQELDLWLTHPLTTDTAAVVGWLVWAFVVCAAVVPPRRLRQAARAAESIGAAILLLAGLPIGLIWWAGWPFPTGLPRQTQVDRWLAEPLTWPTIVTASAFVGWVFWGLLLYAVVVEGVTRLRRRVRWLPRLPVPTPLQGLAGGLFGAAALAMNTPTAETGAGADGGVAVTAEQPIPGSATAGAGPAGSDTVRSPAGVDLPSGGWLPDPFADVVTGAATFTWWLRRHRYQPGPPAGATRSEPDLAPLPPTVAAIQAARQAAAPDVPAEAGAGTGLVVIGQRGSRPLDCGDLPAGGVGLVGPGSLDAARGVLTAHLLTGPNPDRPRILVTTRADIDRLLGQIDAGPFPALRVVDDQLAAVSMLEGVLLDRSRNGQYRGSNGQPWMVLLTAVPEAAEVRSRLAVLLTLGHCLQVAGALLGAWPQGTTWHVDSAGTVPTPPATPIVRLGVLPSAAAEDLVTLAHLTTTPTKATAADPTAPPVLSRTPSPPAPKLDSRPVRLALLGAASVHVHQTLVEIGRSAGVQILALLALHPAGLTSRQLAEAIWPNLRPHLASGRFHTTISDLRRTLHTAADGLEVLTRTSGRYHLNPSHVQVDVWRLRTYIDAAATLAGPVDREAALRAVIDTYTGELAVGQQWPWLPPHRESLRRSVIDAYTALAAARPDQAVYLRLAATRIDPINAYLNRHAIQALTDAGDHAAADALTQTYARDLTTAGLTLHPDNDADPTRTSSPGSA